RAYDIGSHAAMAAAARRGLTTGSTSPLVPAKAGTQDHNRKQTALDSGFRGNERKDSLKSADGGLWRKMALNSDSSAASASISAAELSCRGTPGGSAYAGSSGK